jgi:hypothetical protein
MWAIAWEQLTDSGRQELKEIARNCVRTDASDESLSVSIQAARRLYQQAGVFERMAEIVTEQRSAAADSVRSCRYPRLREVLEFLLDLAVPEQAVEAARQPLTSPDR